MNNDRTILIPFIQNTASSWPIPLKLTTYDTKN